ncbi:hypothetical protein [Lentibacillus sp. CBA3610]|uniref:hypothetical protein n=1 Tax=Lentibacillus sp. CBA3610 TaxID=2518176 RepID=UPI0020D24962|nr:hypothetical protein [Lentibacillus sp. CBA3610]
MKEIYLALDFPAWQEARNLLSRTNCNGVLSKVEWKLFYREGPRLIGNAKKQHNHDVSWIKAS